MRDSGISTVAWLGLAAAALTIGGCGAPAANNAATANGAAGTNGAATTSSAPASNAGAPANGAAPVADAGNESASLVLASDSSLPEPCQTLFREEEACLARSEAAATDEGARIVARTRRNMARITTSSLRESLTMSPDDAARTSLCQSQLDLVRRQTQQNPSRC